MHHNIITAKLFHVTEFWDTPWIGGIFAKAQKMAQNIIAYFNGLNNSRESCQTVEKLAKKAKKSLEMDKTKKKSSELDRTVQNRSQIMLRIIEKFWSYFFDPQSDVI